MDTIAVRVGESVRPKFEIGEVVVTPRAEAALSAWGCGLADLLARHQAGDWGAATDRQRDLNNHALEAGLSLISSFHTPAGETLTVFTRGDRSYTLVHVRTHP